MVMETDTEVGGSGEPGTQTGQVIRWVKELTLGRPSQHLEQASRVCSSGETAAPGSGVQLLLY